jgi:hypothetical protein
MFFTDSIQIFILIVYSSYNQFVLVHLVLIKINGFMYENYSLHGTCMHTVYMQVDILIHWQARLASKYAAIYM